jgi:hypothetical protein
MSGEGGQHLLRLDLKTPSFGRGRKMPFPKAFQFVSSHDGLVCPADWEEGKEPMAANSDGMKKYLVSH